jgi:hypothetical protein
VKRRWRHTGVLKFSREYKRLFGTPPARDAERLREAATVGAGP